MLTNDIMAIIQWQYVIPYFGMVSKQLTFILERILCIIVALFQKIN